MDASQRCHRLLPPRNAGASTGTLPGYRPTVLSETVLYFTVLAQPVQQLYIFAGFTRVRAVDVTKPEEFVGLGAFAQEPYGSAFATGPS